MSSPCVTGPVVLAVIQQAWRVFGPWTAASREERDDITRWVREQCAHLNDHPDGWQAFKSQCHHATEWARMTGA